MAIFDIFNNDAFSTVSMLQAMENLEYLPGRMGGMGIFTPNPVRTESVAIEQRDGMLSLIQTSQRGAPLEQRVTEKRNIRDFRTTRIAKGDRITASEMQFVRAFGEEEAIMQVQAEIARRLTGPMGLMNELELTLERMRLGAVQGIVLDADDSVIYNWYTEMGVSQAAEIAFDFDNAPVGSIRQKLTSMVRSMVRGSKGAVTTQSSIHCLCGDEFYDKLTSHEEVKQIYMNRDRAYEVDGAGPFETFTYGGVTFENYRGTDDNSKVAIPTAEAKFFPVNAPGMFLEVWSPGEQFEHVGQLGQKAYPMIVRDEKRDMYADIEFYSYPLHVCTRPEALRRGRAGA